MYLEEVTLKSKNVKNWDEYPFKIPSIKKLGDIAFPSNVTFFVGENGSGKSTLIEAIAVGLGFNPEGGTKNFNFMTRNSHSPLCDFLKFRFLLNKPKDGFFLRAESFYNLASNIDDLNEIGDKPILNSYGRKSLHEQSHGESFLNVIMHRFSGNSLFILDEPESALSPIRQMSLMSRMSQLVNEKSQFIIATHSPILLAYPGATIYEMSDQGIDCVSYEQTELFQVTKTFVNNPQKVLSELFK